MDAMVKTRKLGGSLFVRIPKEVADKEGIKEGTLVKLEVKKARKSWFGAFPELKPMTREEEFDEQIRS